MNIIRLTIRASRLLLLLLLAMPAVTLRAEAPPEAGQATEPAREPARVYLETVRQIMDATRGRGDYAEAPPGTTFVIRNGTYQTPAGLKVMMWILRGGEPGAPRRFVGESRDGVVIVGRATVQSDHVELENMTFTLVDFEVEPRASFSTVTVVSARDVRIAGLNCIGTGDKGRRGGHIEVMRHGTDPIPEDILIEDCLVDRFGRRADPEGRLDHGIYISSGDTVVVRGCEVRRSSGRGIQLYIHENSGNTISNVIIEDNVIHHNGRLPFTDGIVVATGRTAGLGDLRNVVIRNNLFYRNAFSGIRLNTDFSQEVVVENNTFWRNSRGHARGAEVVIDRGGRGRDTRFTRNVFVPGTVAVSGIRFGTHVVFENNLVDGRPGELDMTRNQRIPNVLLDPANGDFRVADDEFKTFGAQAE